MFLSVVGCALIPDTDSKVDVRLWPRSEINNCSIISHRKSKCFHHSFLWFHLNTYGGLTWSKDVFTWYTNSDLTHVWWLWHESGDQLTVMSITERVRPEWKDRLEQRDKVITGLYGSTDLTLFNVMALEPLIIPVHWGEEWDTEQCYGCLKLCVLWQTHTDSKLTSSSEKYWFNFIWWQSDCLRSLTQTWMHQTAPSVIIG